MDAVASEFTGSVLADQAHAGRATAAGAGSAGATGAPRPV